MKATHKYSIEMFYPKEGWVTEYRYYNVIKSKSDFDTKDIEGKRRNFKYLGYERL